METSVCHFAIRTLQCSFLAAIKSLSYAFISWFAFIFIFSSTQSLSAFWKLAGQLSCLSLFSVLNADVQGLRSVGLKRAFQWGSEVQVVLWNSVSSRLCSLPRSLPVLCGNKWTQESRPKCGTTWGSSPSSALPCYWGRNCSSTLSLNWFVRLMCKQSHNIGRRSYLKSKTKLQK